MSGDQNLKDSVRAYLNGRHSMTLATCTGACPWAAAVYFVFDEHFNFYFLSDRKSRHSADIKENELVAAAVNDDPGDWRQIKGVQLEGHATRVTSPIEVARALALYIRRFPFVKEFFKAPLEVISHMSIAGKSVAFDVYRLSPDRMFFLDNQTGFSHREELLPGDWS